MSRRESLTGTKKTKQQNKNQPLLHTPKDQSSIPETGGGRRELTPERWPLISKWCCYMHACGNTHTCHVHRVVRRIRTSAELPTPSFPERWYVAVLTCIYSVLSSLASPSPTHPELPFVFLALFSVSFQLIVISSQPWGRIHTHTLAFL